MREFIESIKTGEFRIPVCNSCHARVWPPFQFCPVCYSPTSLEKVNAIGTLVEFSVSHVKNRDGLFGVIDLDGIRIVGSLGETPVQVGQKMKLASCGIRDDGTPFYNFERA
jgi:uncharacterized OB-fold protein